MTYIIKLDNHPKRGIVPLHEEIIRNYPHTFGQFTTSSIYEKGDLVTRIEASKTWGPEIEQYCRNHGYIQ